MKTPAKLYPDGASDDVPNGAPHLPAERHVCLYCEYSRVGLGAESPCPECGAVPPPSEYPIAFGDRFSVPRWISAPLLALVLFAALALVAVAARNLLVGRPNSPCLLVPVLIIALTCPIAIVRLVRGERDPRNRKVWILAESSLEVIDGGKQLRIAYADMGKVQRRYGVTLRSRLTVIERVPFLALDAKQHHIWLRDRRMASAIATQINARMRSARKPRRWW